LAKCWKVACEIGGVFSEKLKAFGGGGFETNYLSWDHLVSKYKEKTLRSYINLVDSLLIAYGV
jgi:acyl-CoA-binding protein